MPPIDRFRYENAVESSVAGDRSWLASAISLRCLGQFQIDIENDEVF